MSEQTANLCTTDACESLRARLAKYEDAEGNPISTMAEQARDIESLRLNVAAQVEAHAETRKELAALKAQPSGVVLPPSPYMPGVDPAQLSDYERGEAQGRCDMWSEVARLNSSPVSAGEQCDTCHGQGAVWTGENQSFGYMSMQPPEPIMEACPECSAEPVAMKTHGAWDGLDDLASLPDGTKLYTHPAHQVSDGVVVSRELLERAVYNMELAEMDGPTCRELRALLEVKL